MLALTTACTISFTNVSSIGEGGDIVDENQEASPTVTPTVSLPVKPL